MRAQEEAVIEIERVARVTRRMPRGKVQRLEVVKIVLDFGAELHRKAHRAEDPLELAPCLRHRVERAARGTPGGQRDVEAILGEGRGRRPRGGSGFGL
jgi:hypothetical protein